MALKNGELGLGSFLWSVGHFGSGPGEYSSNYVIDTDPEGTLYVIDKMVNKIHQYAHSKDYVRSADLPLKSTVRNIAAAGNSLIFMLNEDYRMQEIQPFAMLRFDLTDNSQRIWGKIDEIALLQSFIKGGGVSIDPVRRLVYYGYMGDHRIYKTSFDGIPIDTFDIRPDYFIDSDRNQLLGYLDTQDPSDFSQSVNGYAVDVSWVTALTTSPSGIVYHQILRKLDQDPVEWYLEVWNQSGQKVGSQIDTPEELLYADDESLYFRIGIEDPEERYGVARYAPIYSCDP